MRFASAFRFDRRPVATTTRRRQFPRAPPALILEPMFPTIDRRLEAFFRRQSAFAVSSAYLFGSYADGAALVERRELSIR